MKVISRLMAGLLVHVTTAATALAASSQAPVTLPSLLADIGGPANGCPYILDGSGQSVEVSQDHNGPHNNPANTFIANSANTALATAFEPAVYGSATVLKLGTDGVGGQNVATTVAANTYVNPAVSYAWSLRQSGLIPASRPIVILANWVGAQSISDWVDGTPADLWTPLAAQYTLLNSGVKATDGTALSPPGVICPINHVQWNQGQNDTSSAYNSAPLYLGAFDRLIAKFQSLPNWSPFTRMDVAELGMWAGATGSARNDALRQLDSGCRYPFLTMTSAQGMAMSTDNPPVHPDGNSEDLFGRRSFTNDLLGRIGGAYRCPVYSGKPAEITTTGAYVASEDDVRNGAMFYVNGPSIQLPNAGYLFNQPIYLYSVAGATLTSASTLYAENAGGTASSFSLKAGVLYVVYKYGPTAIMVQSVFSRFGNELCYTAGAPYSGVQSFTYKQLSNACYALASATVTITSNFGLQAQFYGSSGTSTLTLASGTFLMPDGSTPTSITLLPGQTVTMVGIVTTGSALLTEVVYDSGAVSPATQYSQPASGATITSIGGFGHLTHVIDPAATIAALTITLPSGPRNGSKVTYAATQAVTSVTWAGGTLGTAQASFTAGQKVTLTYVASQTKWY